MSAVADDIAADFIIEAQEILDRLGEQLVALEQAPEDSAQLNAVFRGFHTLKGGAGFLAITPMVELCHAAEDTLGQARAGQATLQARHFDAAQQSLDYLQSMLDAFGSGQEPPRAPPQLIAQFATSGEETAVLPGPRSRDSAPVNSATPAATGAADSDLISDDEFEALLDNLHGVAPGAGAQLSRVPNPGSGVPAAPKAAAAPAKAAEPEHTVRVDTKRLDAIVNLIGELVLSRNRLKTLRARLRDEELDRAVSSLDIATARLQSAVMRTRMQPVGKVFSRFPKVARDVARSLNKEVDLELVGADTELDRNLVEALADPLVHLVRNAIDHGIESPALREASGKPRSGHVRLSAQQEGDYVSIEVQDDGAGIDPERLRAKAREKGLIDPEAAVRLSIDECLHLVFLPGFSTKSEVTDISGRGVGMDVVQSRIRELSGQIQIQSELGRGSRFVIRVPLTLAILPTLLVQAGDTVYALPLARVVEVLHAPRRSLGWFDGRAVLDRQTHTLPLVDLRQWLNIDAPQLPLLTVVVLQTGESRMGLVVDQVRGREEVVIKPLPRSVRGLPGYAGATLIGDGRLALILDVDGLKS
jgi:two-component system, chemotaxis family, sensor kinase CheA